MKNIQRIGEEPLEAAVYPGLLMHSSVLDYMEKICVHGLVPGGTRSVRTDNFFARTDEAANKAAADRPVGCTLVEMDNSKTPLTWADPVKTHDMRKESDAVFFFSVNLMARAGVQLYFVWATGDFITTDVVPYSCLLSERTRESQAK